MMIKAFTRQLMRPGAKDRVLLYRDLADAIDRKEALLDFLAGEIKNTDIDNNKQRAWILRAMRSRFVGADQNREPASAPARSYGKLLTGLVPMSDLMQIAAIDATAKEEQQAAGFRRLASIVLQKHEMVWEIIKKMVMPIASIPVTYAVAYPSAKMVNSLAEKAPPEMWHGLNYVTLLLSNWILDYGVVAMLVMILCGIGVAWVLPNVTGNFRVRLDNMPGFSLYREFVAADVAMSLSALLSNKVDLMDALEILRLRGSGWVRWQMSRVITTLVGGRSDDYARAFGRGLFSKPMTARIATLTRTAPAFSDALIEIGTTGIADVRSRINTSTDTLSVLVIMTFASLAMIINLGQLSVTSDVEKENQPNKVMERNARKASQSSTQPVSAESQRR